jgi:hypothetical protein
MPMPDQCARLIHDAVPVNQHPVKKFVVVSRAAEGARTKCFVEQADFSKNRTADGDVDPCPHHASSQWAQVPYIKLPALKASHKPVVALEPDLRLGFEFQGHRNPRNHGNEWIIEIAQ